MNVRRVGRLLLGSMVVLGVACALQAAQAEAPLEELLERFWRAPDERARAAVAAEIVASGASFEAVYAGLRRGRTYSDDVPRGRILREREGVGGLRHPYMILVPEDYTPERRLPARLELHGGMGASEWTELDGSWSPGWRPIPNQIVVVPAGWWDSMWWEWSQVENFESILREVRATWNVDDNRVVVVGSSDGGAGLFFHAMRQPDRYAAYAGYIAPPDRLARADFRIDGQMHVSNLAGQLFHLGFGGQDRKVPIEHIRNYMALFESKGALLDWYVLENEGHGFRLPDDREQDLARLLWDTVRDPLPERLSWATERVDRYARRQWLVIDELAVVGEPADESNVLPRWGTPIQLQGPTVPRVPWGRVTVARDGNRFTASTERVARFRVLLSPDEVDLSRYVVVEADGRVVFEGRVEPSVTTLLKWAASDDDRSRLFAAEVVVDLR